VGACRRFAGREIELQADYYAKLRAGHLMTDADLRNITAVPHPNQQMLLLGPARPSPSRRPRGWQPQSGRHWLAAG
jgi:hypothetical protein